MNLPKPTEPDALDAHQRELIEQALDRVYELANRLDGEVHLAPLDADGAPSFNLGGHAWLQPDPAADDLTPDDIPRLCVVTERFDKFDSEKFGCVDGISILTHFDPASQEPRFIKIAGPASEFGDATGFLRHGLAFGHPLAAKPLPAALVAANDNQPKQRFAPVWFDDIAEGEPKEHVIHGVFGVDEFSIVSGLPGSGKSVIATDGACHVAAGLEWHGRRVKQGLVIYVAAERKKLTERRMMAFKKRHGVTGIPLLILGGRIDLTAPSFGDVKAIATTITEASGACGFPCVWIIVDTLTRTFGSGDQNKSQDMTRFVSGCDELRRLTGAHISVIHHTTWTGERGKGAVDLDGAVDVTFMVKKTGKTFSLDCTGANDGEEGNVLTFNMESVTLGVDADGEPTTAPVVVKAGPGAADKLLAAIGGHTANVMDTLRSAIAETGVEGEGEHFPDGVLVVTEDQWRATYYASIQGIPTNTLKQRFNRAKATLISAGTVSQIGQWFWPG